MWHMCVSVHSMGLCVCSVCVCVCVWVCRECVYVCSVGHMCASCVCMRKNICACIWESVCVQCGVYVCVWMYAVVCVRACVCEDACSVVCVCMNVYSIACVWACVCVCQSVFSFHLWVRWWNSLRSSGSAASLYPRNHLACPGSSRFLIVDCWETPLSPSRWEMLPALLRSSLGLAVLTAELSHHPL